MYNILYYSEYFKFVSLFYTGRLTVFFKKRIRYSVVITAVKR